MSTTRIDVKAKAPKMTPRAIRQELKAMRAQLVRALRVRTDYRLPLYQAIRRLDKLAEAVNLDRPKPGPQTGGAL